jgi:hypothetical protein
MRFYIALIFCLHFLSCSPVAAQSEKKTIKRSEIEKLENQKGAKLLLDVWASTSTSIKIRNVVSVNNYFYPVPVWMDYALVEGSPNWSLPFNMCVVDMLTMRFEPVNVSDTKSEDPELRPTTMSIQKRFTEANPAALGSAFCVPATGSFYFTAKDGALAKNALDLHQKLLTMSNDSPYKGQITCNSGYAIKETACPNFQKLMTLFKDFDGAHSENSLSRDMELQLSKKCGEISAVLKAKIQNDNIVAIDFARYDFRKNSFLAPPTDACKP